MTVITPSACRVLGVDIAREVTAGDWADVGKAWCARGERCISTGDVAASRNAT
jgi:hypothetical protein